MCVSIFSTNLSVIFLIVRRVERVYIDIYVKYLLFWSYFSKIDFSGSNLKKFSNIKFY